MKYILLGALAFQLLAKPINVQDNYIISLNYEKQPTYTVKIPKRINITNNECQFEYFYKGDIYANQELHICFPNIASISDGIRNIEIDVVQDNKVYTYTNLTSDYQSDIVTLSHDDLPAGNYTGELCVEIYLANH